MRAGIIIVFLCVTLSAISQEVVSSAGDNMTATGIQISWTLGEPVIETLEGEGAILTQGFHQTNLKVTDVNELQFSENVIHVFPCITSDYVNVHLIETELKLGFRLYNSLGKMLQQNSITNTDTQIDMLDAASGIYLLVFVDDSMQIVHSYKIIKR